MNKNICRSLVVLVACYSLSSAGHAQVDLSGTWDNGSGIDFVKPERLGKSICLMGCDDEQARPVIADSAAPPAARIDRPRYRPEFQDRVNDLNVRQVEEDPVLRCLPPGVPRIGPPDKIVQTADEIVFLYDDVSGNFFRVIPTDGSPHRDDLEQTFLGDAVGWWEDNTLVVETVNFNADTWLTDDGSFHTSELRVIERLSLENDVLTWEATAFDQTVLAEPWVLPARKAVRAESEILEAPLCLERDLRHMIDNSNHDNPR